jgi:hypothetical protein
MGERNQVQVDEDALMSAHTNIRHLIFVWIVHQYVGILHYIDMYGHVIMI